MFYNIEPIIKNERNSNEHGVDVVKTFFFIADAASK
jgi:hypothetical protein